MSPVPVGRLLEKAGSLVLEVTYPSDQELDKKPELAIGALLNAIWNRCFDMTRSGEGAEPPDELFKFLWEWVYRGHALAKKAGLELALQQDNLWDLNLALLRIKKKGRPTKSRHTAIKALFRKTYLGKSWAEVTQRLCQCGKTHEDKLTLKTCQDNLESEVRHLKKELRKHKIDFPPARAQETQPSSERLESSLPKVIATHEESQGKGRKAAEYSVQHRAIAILLSADPDSLTQLHDEFELSDESDALCLFNPWVLGWIPLWFPELRTSESLESRMVYDDLRYKWFDKAFRYYSGQRWPLRGPVDEQRRAVAETLRLMYRAARDEQMPEIDELQPLKP